MMKEMNRLYLAYQIGAKMKNKRAKEHKKI